MSRLAFLGWPAGRGDRGGHLGDQVAALVDGQLGHDARDRALVHAAECPGCLRRLDAERRLKSRLAALAAPPVPGDLADRLLALTGPDGVGGATAATPQLLAGRGGRRERTVRAPRLRRSPEVGPGGRDRPGPREDPPGPPEVRARRRRRVAAVAGGLVSVAGAALGTAFVLGAPPQSGGSPVLPPVATLTTTPGGSLTPGAPVEDAAVGAVRVSLTGAAFGGVLQPVDLEVTGVTTPVLVPAGVPAFVGGSAEAAVR